MWILILSYLGGVLTIFSPCVLPVVPFVFSRSDLPFRRAGLPMLVGMGLSFAGFGVLSVTGGKWVIHANQYGRIVALVLFSVLGLSLIFSRVAEKLSQPFVRLGGTLQKRADQKSGIGSSLLLGGSIGLLWAPCAGPILGLVLAGAALGGSSGRTLALLMVFAAGAATSLGVAIFAGGKVLSSLKRGLGAEVWIKRALGSFVLLAVVAIALGLDTRILAKISYFNTSNIEQSLVDHGARQPARARLSLADEGVMPSLAGATAWLNSPPLTPESLRSKVILVDFWTYSCINCLRTLPYLKAWNEKYASQGLVIIGVHTPEFAFEKDETNVKKAVADLGVTYPVAIDNDNKIWNAFDNHYWPAHYFIDAQGKIRHHHFGEGEYDESEKVIQELLIELHGGNTMAEGVASVQGQGVLAPADNKDIESNETYLGYGRQVGFSSTPAIVQGRAQRYREPASLALNQWAVGGAWSIDEERGALISSHGTLSYRFHARDLHLVLGSPREKPIRFRVTVDGHAPGADHGVDTDENGEGVIREHRLYQLIRQKAVSGGRTFRIEFKDRGAEIYAFTFG